jgi:hypothetical protein
MESHRITSSIGPVIAAAVAGLLGGIGSFYAAAKPEVMAVERQSEVGDTVLCDVANENRALLRRLALGLLDPEPVPAGASDELAAYIDGRNDRRERSRFLVEDATRPLDCNFFFHRSGEQ